MLRPHGIKVKLEQGYNPNPQIWFRLQFIFVSVLFSCRAARTRHSKPKRKPEQNSHIRRIFCDAEFKISADGEIGTEHIRHAHRERRGFQAV
jgi:hypothetical protein